MVEDASALDAEIVRAVESLTHQVLQAQAYWEHVDDLPVELQTIASLAHAVLELVDRVPDLVDLSDYPFRRNDEAVEIGGLSIAVAHLRRTDPKDQVLNSFFQVCSKVFTLVDNYADASGNSVLFKSDTLSKVRVRDLRDNCRAVNSLIESAAKLEKISSAVEVAEGAAQEAKQAAGVAGVATLTGHFAEFAKSQSLAAAWRQAVTVLLVGSVVGIGVFSVVQKQIPAGWGAETVFKLTLSLPLLALAYYFARDASRHALAAQRAREIEVRLKTLGAFTSELTDEVRLDVRSTFAKALYTVVDYGDSDAKEANALGKELTDTVKVLAEAVASIAGKAKDAAK
ncbi:hypothetical protein [Kineosporia sp. R_H_3]|uniref:hypothetical protein n=1 Tax=Kineosporia sp. R_H_3 TaxID=1961848 RepID=UPI00117A241E|nr:hypothetical protein [Kineosporia sp. R_H_3]